MPKTGLLPNLNQRRLSFVCMPERRRVKARDGQILARRGALRQPLLQMQSKQSVVPKQARPHVQGLPHVRPHPSIQERNGPLRAHPERLPQLSRREWRLQFHGDVALAVQLSEREHIVEEDVLQSAHLVH